VSDIGPLGLLFNFQNYTNYMYILLKLVSFVTRSRTKSLIKVHVYDGDFCSSVNLFSCLIFCDIYNICRLYNYSRKLFIVFLMIDFSSFFQISDV